MSEIGLMELISTISFIATPIGIFLAWWQIRLTKLQEMLQFEDGMAREYREIAARIPIKAFLGKDLDEVELQESLADFYHYIDFTNEQIFLRQNGRI